MGFHPLPRPVAALCSVVAAATVLAAQTPGPTRPRTLIAGARILDASAGTYSSPSFVLVEGSRIVSVTPKRPDSLLEDTQTIDAAGLTLVPGLVDAHARVSPMDDLDADYFAAMALAHGVTTVRGLNVRTAWAITQRQRIDSGRTPAPRLFTSGRGIDQAARPDLWLFDAASPAAAADEAKRQASAGVDWVVGYAHVTINTYQALAAAVKGTGTRLAAHPGAASLADLAAAGVHSIETVDYPMSGGKSGAAPASDERWPALQARDAASLVRALVKADVTLVPLLARALLQAYPEEVAADPQLTMLPVSRRDAVVAAAKATKWPEVQAHRKDWNSRAAFLKRFVQAGGRVAAGTGFDEAGYPVPGAGIHTELAALVRAGLTPADAIRAATVNGARLLNAQDRIGAVQPGLAGDLILVEGDPLLSVADLGKIRHVIRNGEVMELEELLKRTGKNSR